MKKRYNEKKLTKLYGTGYISDGGIPNALFWVTEEKSYTIYDPRKKDDKLDKNPKKKSKFFKSPAKSTFVYRVGTSVLVLLFLSTSFYNGRFTFLNGSEVTLEDEHIYDTGKITFYNYDFTFKLKQLSRLKPVLSKDSILVDEHDLHSIAEMSPYDFQKELSILVKDGDIVGTPNTSLWVVADGAINYSYANYILGYYYYTNDINEYFGGTNAASQFFYYDSDLSDDIIGDVVPREKQFSRWVKQYNNNYYNGVNFLGSTLALLMLPERLTYNIFVLGDFIFRW